MDHHGDQEEALRTSFQPETSGGHSRCLQVPEATTWSRAGGRESSMGWIAMTIRAATIGKSQEDSHLGAALTLISSPCWDDEGDPTQRFGNGSKRNAATHDASGRGGKWFTG